MIGGIDLDDRPSLGRGEGRLQDILGVRLLLIVVLGCVIPTPTFAAKCTINEDMVFVIDGKKVFPIGFTMPPPPEGKTPAGKKPSVFRLGISMIVGAHV